MNYFTMNSGYSIPCIGLGTAGLYGNECEEIVCKALSIGYRLIDTAQIYKNEQSIGNAIKASHINRKEIFLVTKLFEDCNGYELAIDGVYKSLEKLKVDYLDLVLIHEPYSKSIDMYEALLRLKEDGLIKSIGISNFYLKNIGDFLLSCKEVPSVNQIECHVLYQQKELIKINEDNNIITMAWSPLTHKRSKILSDENIKKIAKKHNKTEAQICLKYLLQSNVVIIPKTTNEVHLSQNIDLFDFKLNGNELDIIRSLDLNKSLDPRFRKS